MSYKRSPVVEKRSFEVTQATGYTVIEVMIFLSLSVALFFLVIGTFSGQQARAEFSTSVRDIDSKLQDVINNVSSGLYSNNGSVKCQLAGTRIEFINTSTAQGTNAPCVYIGQMIHFAPDADRHAINIYSVAGKRLDGATGKEITNIHDSEPLLIADGGSPPFNGGGPDTTEVFNMPSGLKVEKVSYNATGTWVETGSIGFFTTFGAYNASGSLTSGSQTTNLVVLVTPPAPGLDTDKQNMVRAMDQRLDNAGGYIINPANGVKICFASDATDQVAVVTISGDRSSTNTRTDIFETIALAVAAGHPC